MRGEQNWPSKMTKILLMDKFHLNYHELMSTPAYIVKRMLVYIRAEAEVLDEERAAQEGGASRGQVRDAFDLAVSRANRN